MPSPLQREYMRAYRTMLPEEREIIEAYRERQSHAFADFDPDEHERCQQKIEAMYDHVIRREMIAHREVDKLDTNIPE